MSAATEEEASIARGEGWHARVTLTHIHISVLDDGDYLPAAIDALLSPIQQQFWISQWDREDEGGWQVWVLTRRPALKPV